MSATLSQIKEDIKPKLHGVGSLDKVPGNFYRHCYEAGNRVLNKIDPKSTIRSSQIVNALYGRIYDYQAPVDIKGNKVVDIKPQGKRSVTDSIFSTSRREFDIKKYLDSVNIKEVDGIKYLRVSKDLGAPLFLHNCDSVTADGTWVASEDASGLVADSYRYLGGVASLRFNLSGSTGVGKITISDMSPKDISSLEDVGAIFKNLYWPSATAPTSVELRWGSGSSNYWTKTVTTPHELTTFRQGWNLLRFDWSSATEVGTPDSSAIDYIQVILTYTSGTIINNVYIDGISAHREIPYDIEYFSSYLWKNSSGVYLEQPTADTDTINLDGTAYNIFIYELADIISQITQAEESSFDVSYFRNQLDAKEETKGFDGLYRRYETEYPSESLVSVNEYYDMGYESTDQDNYLND